ncbi:hypothetical protein WG66_001682 [Moniliophthora roreri]|nr:hypothetical protein WG66_001682 [Moniliophthora roreri]
MEDLGLYSNTGRGNCNELGLNHIDRSTFQDRTDRFHRSSGCS